MFCPQCGSSQSEELKFCKSCGANLYAVRQAVTTRETSEKFDWSKTWVAEMFLSEDEQKIRKQERERRISPEEKKSREIEKRYNEIKAGVILSFVGIGVMIFLYVFMNGIILSGNIPPNDAEIIRRIWVAGVIPFCVGLGMLFNGLVVSKKLVELAKREQQAEDARKSLASAGKGQENLSLSSADWYESGASKPSVTENTTRQLENPGKTQ